MQNVNKVTLQAKSRVGNAKLHIIYRLVTLFVTFQRNFVLPYASHSYPECEFETHLSYKEQQMNAKPINLEMIEEVAIGVLTGMIFLTVPVLTFIS